MQRIVGNRYELVRPLGRGGMGEVWLGRDARLDRDVAVKLLRPSSFPAGSDIDSLISRFDREARLTAKLENPGVPAVYDTGQDEDDLYLVMQLIAGADLAEFQAENEPVPVGWVVAIGVQIASVLGAAHAAGLVHRDLKPRNVMITEKGEIKVLDFGIAVLRNVDMTRITRTAEAVGTPAYMAPEQAMHGQASPSSDLYSLGCVLYELVTGQYVFDADTPLAMMHRHYSDTPIPVLSHRPEAGPRVADLITRLLAKQPHQRPVDAREVYDTLVALLPPPSNGPLIPMDPTRPFREKLSAPQRPSPSPTTVGFTRPTPPPPEPPTVPAYRPVVPPPTTGPYSGPIPSPAGTLVAATTPPPVLVQLDTPGRRIGEGVLITFGLAILGFYFADKLEGQVVPDPAITIAIALIPVLFGLRMRKNRLRLRFYWSLAPFGKRAAPPRVTSRAERVVERILLITGGVLLFVFLASWGIDLAGGQKWSFSTSPLTGLVMCLAMLLPGAFMRQHRLGKGYPWSP